MILKKLQIRSYTKSVFMVLQSKEEGKDQSDKFEKHKKTQHIKSQEVSPFPTGAHKAARSRLESISKTNMKHK